MQRGIATTIRTICLGAVSSLLALSSVLAAGTLLQDSLGPQSSRALGEKHVLMVVVRFPDVAPRTPLETVKERVTTRFNRYLLEQSYGQASLKADFRGYVMLPDPLADYRVSPYNFRVDKRRVRKLVEDTLTALEAETDFFRYDHILIIPAVHTMPGTGYGMICYCANPGMLSGVIKQHTPSFVTVRSSGDKEFNGGIFVGTENANLGMFAHDYFHALGGLYQGKRVVP